MTRRRPGSTESTEPNTTPAKPTSTYTRAPTISEEMQIRYAACLSVVSGHTSVSEAARRLGMSRNRFQSILHRGLGAMVEAIAPQPPGRPAKSAREVELEEEVEELQRQLHHLQVHAELTERLLATVSEAMKKRATPRARSTPTRGAKKTTAGGSDDEPAALLRVVEDFRGKLPLAEVSAVMGRSPSTCRRWVDRAREGQPLRARRGPKPVPQQAPAAAAALARTLVRETHGLVGTAALAKATGLSRREAAAVKHDTCTLVEQERKVESARVRVVYPGLIRAFDAMHLRDCEGKTYLLSAGDAAVPYRTTLFLADAYDSDTVCAALQADFEAYGPPLVLRMDRASAHRTPAVAALLDRWGVLVLHGPPHHPRFYGQLERQNREHRAWLRDVHVEQLGRDELVRALEQMRHALTTSGRVRRSATARRPRCFALALSSTSTDGSYARRSAALRRAASRGTISKATKPGGPTASPSNKPSNGEVPSRS